MDTKKAITGAVLASAIALSANAHANTRKPGLIQTSMASFSTARRGDVFQNHPYPAKYVLRSDEHATLGAFTSESENTLKIIGSFISVAAIFSAPSLLRLGIKKSYKKIKETFDKHIPHSGMWDGENDIDAIIKKGKSDGSAHPKTFINSDRRD